MGKSDLITSRTPGGSSGAAGSTAAGPAASASSAAQSAATAYAGAAQSPAGRELWDPQRGPQASDVAQGNTGDCWLMGELGSLAAQSPEVIRNMIHEDPDHQGATVTLHNPADGSAVNVHVSLPAGGKGGNGPGVYQSAADALQPVGQDGMQHTWASYIEAAMGQYISEHQSPNDPNHIPTGDGLSAGRPSDAGKVLTGKDSQKTDIQAPTPESPQALDKTWHALQGANSGRVVTAQTVNSDAEPVLPSGVESGHVYSILGTEQDAQGNRYVLARDPKGARSGATPEDVDGQPGVKRFRLEDFVQSFSQVQVLGPTRG